MLRARLIRALPLWLQAHVCLVLIGHVYHLETADAGHESTLRLACEVCRHRSVGVTTARRRTRRALPGDARRFQSYARRIA